MRTAVMRVVIDAEGVLSAEQYEAGLDRLRARGLELVATPAAHLPHRDREIELLLTDADVPRSADHVALCEETFGLPAAAGVVTYTSRGTDDDVHGVLAGFGIIGGVARSYPDGDELVTVTVTEGAMRSVSESRLHTALVAALNCEVRIVVEPVSA